MKLKGKQVVVTGGARGIGRALCVRFASEEAAGIVVADRDLEGATETAQSVGGIAVQCDVTSASDVENLVQVVEEKMGRIDLFCSNAGIAEGGGVELTDDRWMRILEVNLMAHVYAARAALPGMLRRGEGYLLQTASAAGLLTELGSAPYAVSKHGAVALAEWLAIAYCDRGIRVSCLCPQGVHTAMLEGDAPNVRWMRDAAITPEQVAESVVAGIEREQFLILPHPEVAKYFRNKATDYDRWLADMQKLRMRLGIADTLGRGPA